MTSYIFGNAAQRETEQRFSSLESIYDPPTRAILWRPA